MLRQASVVGVLAIGMTFVIATAGIDLSVGSMVAAAGVFGGQLADSGSVAFMLGALGLGIAAGRRQRAAIAYGRVVPFIATLAMFSIARGLALLLNDKLPVTLFEPRAAVRWFGTGEVVGIPSVGARLPGHHGRPAGSCSTARATAATSSPSAATARRRGSPA